MAAKLEIYKHGRGQFLFRLKAANGEIVASGEPYTTEDGAKRGVEAVKTAAANAPVEDLT